jgi:hypothetical protein
MDSLPLLFLDSGNIHSRYICIYVCVFLFIYIHFFVFYVYIYVYIHSLCSSWIPEIYTVGTIKYNCICKYYRILYIYVLICIYFYLICTSICIYMDSLPLLFLDSWNIHSRYVYIYVFMYVFFYLYVYIFLYLYMYTCIHICIFIPSAHLGFLKYTQ